ncbi:bifunctional phosphoribosyl-AMP cyclohydrolase/phosphoribosyl-ATP diphosphatase HisIE [Brevibacillus laterosporus]|uniref:Histidine biosynthesis bifunctional protein HisIE n=1 Tax=Brevibacillus laterosporus LMG 15441 TaxID=1042163 RepID=A0A075R9M7_BRELA|nr:bifunctional phosphoribosyl-AMP cyclohydrolase/phosphoribosyl-ATP diphosphatase HisIE [Brevibacillus laterosporus]AIG28594.1 phosphoribosyl-ATP pyrophosphatase [Brevibacillus laterosporus LMG 15441]RJL12079.1 bifunctional phosphoribosyl-AMP cyclohydrolase/phosphoribosyl-ATP diphosphatase HisIE [Brevibacillus laterosporus]TPH19006.1 bifunctional phosphoribosyl-AMP cyclohydrolase/phosphoribosyl-ATP diphosphatase HisIE [Brevibacillus laterosporus]
MRENRIIEQLRFDDQGLVPVIIQHALTKEVLTLAYMNKEALEKTYETNETWLWSRSRQELWNKGAKSGNRQKLISISADCDGDTLLLKVLPAGPACHTGSYSCFSRETEVGEIAEGSSENNHFFILKELEALIATRQKEMPVGAYTTYLFEKGIDKILKKVGEEAAEVLLAAKNRNQDELRYEMADLFYHLLVLLREQNLPLEQVLLELQNRQNKNR